MLLSLDGTFFVQILNFIVFWVLLNYLFIAPTRRAIEGRQKYVANLYREGDELVAQARSLESEAAAVLAAARRRTEDAMRAAAARASQETHAIVRAANEEAAATIALAQATVASERAAAQGKQAAFIQELAQSMVERATAPAGT